MVRQKFTALLATAAVLALLAVPAFAEEADAAVPAADSTTAVQQDETAPAAEVPEMQPAAEESAESASSAVAAETEPAQPEAETPQLTYVALGDSITAGVGLEGLQTRTTDTREDFEPNFEGYPSQCYVSLVADGLGLDRQHAIDLGLSGLQSGDMLRLVSSDTEDPSWSYYYPQYREYIKNADIISVQIGANDATGPAFAALSAATHQKSEQLVGVLVNGTMRDLSPESFRRLNDSLAKLAFTPDEIGAVWHLLFEGGTDAICEQAYTNVTTNLPQIIAGIRALNPDAKILLLGYTNPVPLLPEWSGYFNRLNSFARDLANQNENVTFVSISLTPSSGTDGHPTVCGHRYIANRILKSLR